MMKHWRRLLTMATFLCMLLTGALAAGGTVFPERQTGEPYRSVFEMVTVGDGVYFLVYTHEEMQLWHWREGMETAEKAAGGLLRASDYNTLADAANKAGIQAARHAIGTIFSDGERLMGVNPLNGLIFEISAAEGTASFTDMATMENTACFFRYNGEMRWYLNPRAATASGAYLYWFGAASGEEEQIHRISLTDGSVTEIPVEKLCGICRYKEGKLLILTDDNQLNKATGTVNYAVAVYDPSDDGLTAYGEIGSPRTLNRIIYAPEMDVILWQEDTSIMGMQAGGEAKRYAYVNSTLSGQLAAVGETLVFSDTNQTVSCELVEGYAAPATLRVMNASFGTAERAYALANPQSPIEIVRDPGDEGAMAFFAAPEGKRADAACLYTGAWEKDYETLRDSGLLMDLSQDEAVRAWIDALQPAFRELVVGEQGEIWAIPTKTVSYTGFFANRKAMADAGVRPEDLPTNFADLCGFVTRWNTDYAERYPNYACFEYAEDTRAYLLDMLIDMWVTHCLAEEKPIRFADPAFLEALTALEKMECDKIDAGMKTSNPEVSDYKTGLFWTNCQLVGNWAAYMEEFSDRIFIPLTVTADTPYYAEVETVGLWTVNRATENPEYALAYLREQMNAVTDKYRYVLLTTETEPIPSGSYEALLAVSLEERSRLEKLLEEATDPATRSALQNEIDIETNWIEGELRRSMYTISPSAIQNYQEVLAPALYIQQTNTLQNTSTGVNAMQLIKDRWLGGKITSEQLIRQADAQLTLMELGE